MVSHSLDYFILSCHPLLHFSVMFETILMAQKLKRFPFGATSKIQWKCLLIWWHVRNVYQSNHAVAQKTSFDLGNSLNVAWRIQNTAKHVWHSEIGRRSLDDRGGEKVHHDIHLWRMSSGQCSLLVMVVLTKRLDVLMVITSNRKSYKVQ